MFNLVKWIAVYTVALTIIAFACLVGSVILPTGEDLYPAMEVLVRGLGL